MTKELTLFDKFEERRIILRRLFWSDRDFFKIGNHASLEWFERFREKFLKDNYAYFADEEKKDAIYQITHNIPDDVTFVNSLNHVYGLEKRYQDIDVFIGQFYYFETKTGVTTEDRRNELVEKTKGALDDTKGRAAYFLKSIIELYKEDRWDRAYSGATWEDILAKTRELHGSYPSPRDLVILKSYKIYFRTGSRRYPTHTIPEEMIPTIDGVLKYSSIR